MIPRYSRPEMVAIWSDENKYKIWLQIETIATQMQAGLKTVPEQAYKDLRDLGNFNINKINEIEQEVKHDVIAFLTNVSEYVGENSRYVHQGMTSSDVLDTCLAVQLSQANNILFQDLKNLLSVLKKKSYDYKDSLCIGRSHGIHAEPTTIGLKFASFYAEFERNYDRLMFAQKEIGTCAISGAVGTFANVDPAVENHVASCLRLKAEPISTQIIPRDRHAVYFSILGVIASSIERLATEIRHLQRTEVREAMESFSKGQKGSSAMPHKRNPILSENLTGLARMIRSSVTPAFENVATWHERDISHSSVERMIAPDSTILLDFALSRLATLVENLEVDEGRALDNLKSTKYIFSSQRILLALTQNGVSREDAYKWVQDSAIKTWEHTNGRNFVDFVLDNKNIMMYLSQNDIIDMILDMSYHTKHVNTIFTRVFKNSNFLEENY